MKPRLAAVATAVLSLPLLALAAVDGPATAGPPASGERQVNTTTAFSQFQVSTASDALGDAVVVWTSEQQDGSGYGVYAQRYDAAGVAQGTEVRVNTTTAGDQSAPSVAMDADGDYVVAWQSAGQDGSGLGVYARRFAADGASRGSDTRVNVVTAGDQYAPSVAIAADGSYVVAWTSSGQDGSLAGVYARRYNAAGTALAGESRVNQTTTGRQDEPSIAMDADGAYVVTWSGAGAGGTDGIYAQRYGVTGAPRGGETKVNTTASSAHRFPDVAMSAEGDYVVVWVSTGQDGDSDGIYSQRFGAAGGPQGAETRVNVTTAGGQYAPTVAMDADGDHLVTWTSQDQDGDGLGVYLRRYASSGSPQGGEVRVSTTVANDQHGSSVSVDADGDAVASWASFAQDGSLDGVYARRFRGPDGVDLRLDQFGPAQAPVDGQVVYRIRVANLDDPTSDTGIPPIDSAVGTATGVYVVSTIPDGASYTSATGAGWTCAPGAAVVTCRLSGALAAGGASLRLALTYVLSDDAGTVLHPTSVFEDQLDPNASNNAETVATDVLCTFEFPQAGFPTPESGAVTIEVDRTGTGCGPASVDADTVAGTATSGVDFGDTGWVLLFDDADTAKTFDVPIAVDALDEPNEQFRVRLSNPSGALLGRQSVAVSTIFDDDAPPRINFTTSNGTAAEPGALVDLTLRLSAVSGVPVTVTLTKSGTATSGADYFAPTKVTIPAGQRSADLTVEVADDAVAEGDETAVLTLAAPSDVVLGSLRTFRLTITSDD